MRELVYRVLFNGFCWTGCISNDLIGLYLLGRSVKKEALKK